RRLAEREQLRRVANRTRLALADFVDVDAVVEDEPAMEELHLERKPGVAPERMLGAKSQRPIGVVAELRPLVGKGGLERLVRRLGALAGQLAHRRAVERRAVGRARSRRVLRGERTEAGPCAETDACEDEFPSLQSTPPRVASAHMPGVDADRRAALASGLRSGIVACREPGGCESLGKRPGPSGSRGAQEEGE